jgi:hypothetical protein
VTYVEFLGQWYNAVFLLLGALGVTIWIVGRVRKGRPDSGHKTVVTGTLIGAAVVGLTINGAVHDLALGDPAARFPLVLATSAIVAFLLARGYRRLAQRYFPTVRDVRIDSPDLSGLEARVVSRNIGREPRSGRVQRQTGDTLHLVHCHTSEEGVRFGRTVRLVEYEPALGSYRVERVR